MDKVLGNFLAELFPENWYRSLGFRYTSGSLCLDLFIPF